MRVFRSFFMISLGIFLFLFLTRFLFMAFIAAIILTFISYVVRTIRNHANNAFDGDHYLRSYNHQRAALPYADEGEEPLFFEKEKESTYSWSPDYRTIEVR